MKLIFIGGLYPEIRISEITNNSIQMPYFAADTHQKAIIEGLDHHIDDLTIINAPHIPNFPLKYKKFFFKSSNWSHNGKSKDVDISFLNVFGIKHIWRIITITLKLLTTIRNYSIVNPKESIVLMTYGLHLPFLVAALINRRIFKKSTRWCLIVPEIPKYYTKKPGLNKIYKTLKGIDWFITNKLLTRADCYELITEDMASLLNIKHKPYTVVEAIIRESDFYEKEKSKNDKSEEFRTVLYTGTTAIEFGIEDLLSAFSLIKDDNYRLLIYGTGTGDKIITNYAKRDARIIFKGFAPRNEIIKQQINATVLVNPRTPIGEYTRYSFPSKTVEYMLSGTPVIMHDLPGMPDDYKNYVNIFKSDNIESMASQLKEICEWPTSKQIEFGRKAQTFVLNEKNSIVQGGKLYKLIKNAI